MSLFSRLARDSLWLLIARIATQVCMVIVTYLLARRLSVAGFGEYSFIAAGIVIGNTVTTFGSDMYLIREIAAKSEFSQLSSALILQLILSCLFIGFVFWFAPNLPNQTPESILALRIYIFALIPLAFFTVFTSLLRGGQRMVSYAWLNIGIAILQVIVISVNVRDGTSVVTLAHLLLSIQLVGALLGGIFCAINFPEFWKDWHFSLNETINLFIACMPIAMIATLGILYQKLSFAMLSLLGSASMVGWFAAAVRTMEAARIGHIAAFTVLYPAMANSGRDKNSHRTFKLSWMLLLIVASGAVVLLFSLAKPIINIFFGADYQSSISVLKILSFMLVPYTVNAYLSLAFLAGKREKVVVRTLFISLTILLLSNLWLIPRAGQIGAAWAFLIAETVQSLFLMLEWKINPLLMSRNVIPDQGVPRELPDLSRQT